MFRFIRLDVVPGRTVGSSTQIPTRANGPVLNTGPNKFLVSGKKYVGLLNLLTVGRQRNFFYSTTAFRPVGALGALDPAPNS